MTPKGIHEADFHQIPKPENDCAFNRRYLRGPNRGYFARLVGRTSTIAEKPSSNAPARDLGKPRGLWHGIETNADKVWLGILHQIFPRAASTKIITPAPPLRCCKVATVGGLCFGTVCPNRARLGAEHGGHDLGPGLGYFDHPPAPPIEPTSRVRPRQTGDDQLLGQILAVGAY